jgi:hypothetical protein
MVVVYLLRLLNFSVKSVNVDFGIHMGQVSSALKRSGPTEGHSAPTRPHRGTESSSSMKL